MVTHWTTRMDSCPFSLLKSSLRFCYVYPKNTKFGVFFLFSPWFSRVFPPKSTPPPDFRWNFPAGPGAGLQSGNLCGVEPASPAAAGADVLDLAEMV